METYCLRCKKNTANRISSVTRIQQKRLMLASTYAICGMKKTRFIKYHEVSGILSTLGIKTKLNKIPFLSGILL